jgi:ABC-type transport system substrate-binding protein
MSNKLAQSKLMQLFSIMILLSLVLSACAPAATPAPETQAPAQTEAPVSEEPAATEAPMQATGPGGVPVNNPSTDPKYGGTLKSVLFATIDKLDPQVAISFQEWFLVTLFTHNGLMKYDMDDQLKPDLAESYEMNEDGTEFTFKLNKGRKFSNGREMVAADVKYSLSRTANPKVGSWGQMMTANIVGAPEVIAGDAEEISGIEIVDDYTVKFHLIEPQSTFVMFLAASPQFINPKEEVEKWGDEYPMHAVGTGPYMIKEWEAGSKLVLEKNPYYYELPERPYVDQFEFIMNIDEQTTLLQIEAGEADMTADLMPSSVVQQVINDPNWQPYIYTRAGFSPMFTWMNSENPPFDNLKVRQAVLYAIDHEKLRKIMTGVGTPTFGLYAGPQAPGFDPNFDPYPYNPEKAKQLLAEAGFPDGFETKYYWHDEVASWTIFPVPVQQMLADVGIKAELIKVSVPAKNEMAANKEMPMFIGGWGPAIVDSAEWYTSIFLCSMKDQPTGYPSYCNPKIDEMFSETQQTFDMEKRAEIFREMEDILMADAPMIPLMNMSYFVLVNPRVKNYSAHILTPPSNPWVWLDPVE